jgi:hypothetical protein
MRAVQFFNPEDAAQAAVAIDETGVQKPLVAEKLAELQNYRRAVGIP